MKVEIAEASVPGRYIFWISPDDGPLAFCIECAERDLKILYSTLREMFGNG